MEEEPGTMAEPKRTAVPSGDDRCSSRERLDADCCARPLEPRTGCWQSWTGKADKKPVLFTAGSPFTVVKSVISSSEKKTCETVFVGPTGGVLCPRSKGRRSSMGPSPRAVNCEQETPATAPVEPTQTSEFLAEAATVVGNSAGMGTGSPTRRREVGFWGSMVSMERVFDPALTAKMFWSC
jgi:hypothetical protein